MAKEEPLHVPVESKGGRSLSRVMRKRKKNFPNYSKLGSGDATE